MTSWDWRRRRRCRLSSDAMGDLEPALGLCFGRKARMGYATKLSLGRIFQIPKLHEHAKVWAGALTRRIKQTGSDKADIVETRKNSSTSLLCDSWASHATYSKKFAVYLNTYFELCFDTKVHPPTSSSRLNSVHWILLSNKRISKDKDILFCRL